MSSESKRLTCEHVNDSDLVDYLSSLGFYPKKVKGTEYWYISPFRDERTASFKVNRNINAWYDHGLGIGGKLVDFAIRFHQCTVKELLAKLQNDFPFHKQAKQQIRTSTQNNESAIKIVAIQDLSSILLRRYLTQRRITGSIAQSYCREIIFELNSKQYEALGFVNDKGGYELRNPWFKGGCSPKDISSFMAGEKEMAVFEGFFDFLSYKTIFQNQAVTPTDFVILNSLSFADKSRSILDQYERVHLYLDNDTAGRNCTQRLVMTSPKFIDESHLYKGHKDLNEWAQQIGKSNNKRLRPGP